MMERDIQKDTDDFFRDRLGGGTLACLLIWRKARVGGVRQSIRRLVAIWISLLLREGFEGGKHITLHYKATGRQHEGAA